MHKHFRRYYRTIGQLVRPRAQPQLVRIDDQRSEIGRHQKLPRIVHQTAESRLVHPKHAQAIADLRKVNEDLSFHLYDKTARDRYMAERWSSHSIYNIYRSAAFGQMKADIFRYCVVFDRGGYYLDFNKGSRVAITKLHRPSDRGIISYESNIATIPPDRHVARELFAPLNLLSQWFFGFEREHPFLEGLIERIVGVEPMFRKVVFPRPKDAVITISGPGIFTAQFREYVKIKGSSGIAQAGIDLHGEGIFRLPGSKLLSPPQAYYGRLRDRQIFLEP